MKNVAIIDGFAEGKWHHRILNEQLRASGYNVTSTIEQADVVIAHSAGCFFLPDASLNQIILLIGPPYWPGKPLMKSMNQKVRSDFNARKKEGNLRYFAVKTFWNITYCFQDLSKVSHMRHQAKKHNLPEIIKDKDVHIIRNHDDSWLSPEARGLLAGTDGRYHTLPGDHDDAWVNPKPYVEILERIRVSRVK